MLGDLAVGVVLSVIPTLLLSLAIARLGFRQFIKGAKPDPSSFPKWIAVCLVMTALAYVALQEIDAVLRGMHALDRVSAGISSLASRPATATTTWLKHATLVRTAADGVYNTGLTVVVWHAIVDSFLFVPFYCTLLYMLLRRTANRLTENDPQLKRLATGMSGLLVVTLAAVDVIENVLEAGVATSYTRGGGIWPLRYLLWGAGSLKWVLLATALLGLVILSFIAARTGPLVERLSGGDEESPVVATRLLLVVTLIFGVGILLPEQAWDIPRRWNRVHAALAVVATLGMVLVGWKVALRLIAVGQLRERVPLRARHVLPWGVGLTVLGCVFLWREAKMTQPGFYPWGVLIPGVMLLVLGGLSAITRGTTLQGTDSLGTDRHENDPASSNSEAIAKKKFRGTPTQESQDRGWATVATAIGGIAAAIGIAVWSTDPWGPSLGLGGGAVAVLGALSLLPAPRTVNWFDPNKESVGDALALARLLAAAPLAFLGLALVRSSAATFIYSRGADHLQMLLMLVGGAALAMSSIGFAQKFLHFPSAPPRPWRFMWFVRLPVLVAAGIAAWAVLIGPEGLWSVSQTIGAVAILAIFCVALLLVGGAVFWFGERVQPPAFLKMFRVNRLPVLALLVIWALLASFEKPGYHDIRRLDASVPTEAIDVEDAWQDYAATNEQIEDSDETSGRPAQPVFFVAASGGGIRAAYWTALVLDCLFETDPVILSCEQHETGAVPHPVFLASGISGGSLGIATYSAYISNRSRADSAEGWPNQLLDHDFLSPSLTWQLFIEAPRTLFRYNPGMDRAEVLERGWEYAWDDPTVLATGLFEHTAAAKSPVLVLNGATVAEGCRFVSSVLDEGTSSPATGCRAFSPFEDGDAAKETQALTVSYDLGDFLCEDEDVPLSTAVLLSARFPYVSPSGRVVANCGPGEGIDSYVLDGGVLESSAALPAVDLEREVRGEISRYNEDQGTCFVPFFIQIDNGYEIPESPPKGEDANELTAPPNSERATRATWLSNARQAAAIEFTRPIELGLQQELDRGAPEWDRYVHIYPTAHPGVQAPLGWSLSDSAQADLRKQLQLGTNPAEMEYVRQWARGDMDCPTS